MSASTAPDIKGMATFIAQQIHASVAPDEPWDDMTDADQQEFAVIAFAAAGAHDAWLQSKGFRILPPGVLAAPNSQREAQAMIGAGEAWFRAQAVKQVRRKLILPPR